MQVTFEDGTDKEFRNVVVSQPKPHTVGNPKTKKHHPDDSESLEDTISQSFYLGAPPIGDWVYPKMVCTLWWKVPFPAKNKKSIPRSSILQPRQKKIRIQFKSRTATLMFSTLHFCCRDDPRTPRSVASVVLLRIVHQPDAVRNRSGLVKSSAATSLTITLGQ